MESSINIFIIIQSCTSKIWQYPFMLFHYFGSTLTTVTSTKLGLVEFWKWHTRIIASFLEILFPRKDGSQTKIHSTCHLWIGDLLWYMICWTGSVECLTDCSLLQLQVPYACKISVEPLLLQCLHKLERVFCCTFLLAGGLTNEGHAWLLAMKRRYFPSTCEGQHG